MVGPLVLVAASGLGWAALDALRKTLGARLRATPLVVLLALGQLPLFLAWVAGERATRIEAGYLTPGGTTIVLNVVANLLFIRSLQVSPLSVTIPFLSFTPVFSAVFSAFLLGESLAMQQRAGIALVVTGAFLVNLRTEDGVLRMVRERGSLLMTATALLWSLTAPLDKRSLQFADVPVHASIQCAGVGLVLLAMLAGQGRLRELLAARGVAMPLALALLVSGAALGLGFVAIQLLPVGVVEALKRAIGMASSVVVGAVAFHEPVTPGKLVGIALLSCGVAALVL